MYALDTVRREATEADLIRWAEALAEKIWIEVFRHPGAKADDVDTQEWRRAMHPLAIAIVERRVHIADHNDEDGKRPLWDARVWALIFALRGSEYRPKWPEVRRLVHKHLGVRYQIDHGMTGEEAAALRVVRAPDPLALPAPPPRNSELVPGWVRRVPTLDGGGPFDRMLLTCLLNIEMTGGEAAVDLTLSRIREDRRKAAEEREERGRKNREKEAALRKRREGTGGPAADLIARMIRDPQYRDVLVRWGVLQEEEPGITT